MESTKVLIVEDEGIVARDLQRTLKQLGYSVRHWATTGEEGVAMVGKNHPDLVIMDIHLGGKMDGVEAAIQIRDRFDTPVIFLTAYSDKPTLDGAKRAQPYGYVLKPFDENELRTNIEVALYKHQKEKEQKENQRFLESVVSHFPGYVYRCRLDEPMTVTYISPGIKEFLGYSPKDILDRPAWDWNFIRHPDDQQRVEDRIREAAEGGESYELEYRVIGKTGEIRWALEQGLFVREGGKSSKNFQVEGFVTDITSRRKAAEILLHSQKMESLGRLAGGIAHSFNNYLLIIFSGLFLIKEESSPKSEIYQKAELLESESERARFLTQRLLTFAQGGKPVLERVALVPLIKETADLIFRNSRVETHISETKDLSDIHADAGRIAQVFVILLENAGEAMSQGGSVRVELEKVEILSDQEPNLKPGGYVRVFIRDEGPGIPNENRDKVFEPFFTTKGGHSGLGLSAAFSMIQNHGGSISHEANISKGTTFVLHLPVFPAAEVAEPAPPLKKWQGKRILLMDDELNIQKVLRDILTHMGFEVKTCSEGEAAVRIYRENKEAGQPFDCVILDLTVPRGMSGEIAVKLIKSYDPGARVIASSGYSKNPVMGNRKKFGFSGVLPKPYSTDELERVLGRVLSE